MTIRIKTVTFSARATTTMTVGAASVPVTIGVGSTIKCDYHGSYSDHHDLSPVKGVVTIGGRDYERL